MIDATVHVALTLLLDRRLEERARLLVLAQLQVAVPDLMKA